MNIDNIITDLKNGSFKLYRENYDLFSYRDKQILNRLLLDKYPHQYYYDLDFFKMAINMVDPMYRTVYELGGFDGSLARDILKDEYVVYWDNYEIVSHIIAENMCRTYREIICPFTLGDLVTSYNIFCSSDTIEHFSNKEIDEIMKVITDNTHLLALQIDVRKGGQDFTGDFSTHITSYGFEYFDSYLSEKYEKIVDQSKVLYKTIWRRKEKYNQNI